MPEINFQIKNMVKKNAPECRKLHLHHLYVSGIGPDQDLFQILVNQALSGVNMIIVNYVNYN